MFVFVPTLATTRQDNSSEFFSIFMIAWMPEMQEVDQVLQVQIRIKVAFYSKIYFDEDWKWGQLSIYT